MGYWNETCLLTNLPIQPGEPCAALLITERVKPMGKTLTDSFYMPIGPVLFGKYDGFGRLDDCQPNVAFEEAVLLTWPEVLATKKQNKYLQITTRHLTELFDIIKQEPCIYYRHVIGPGPKTKYTPVYLVLIKQDFFKYAIEHGPVIDSMVIPELKDLIASNHLAPNVVKAIKKGRIPEYYLRHMIKLMVFMNRRRIDLRPTIGAGSQSEIDTKDDLGFYQMMLDAATENYNEHNFQPFG